MSESPQKFIKPFHYVTPKKQLYNNIPQPKFNITLASDISATLENCDQ